MHGFFYILCEIIKNRNYFLLLEISHRYILVQSIRVLSESSWALVVQLKIIKWTELVKICSIKWSNKRNSFKIEVVFVPVLCTYSKNQSYFVINLAFVILYYALSKPTCQNRTRSKFVKNNHLKVRNKFQFQFRIYLSSLPYLDPVANDLGPGWRAFNRLPNQVTFNQRFNDLVCLWNNFYIYL